jgi:hypothetical protein
VTTPTIKMHNDHEIKVEFDYDPEAVKQIKAEIPGPGRRWDGKNKCWIVQVDFADYASDILTNVFGGVDIDGEVYKHIKAMRKHEQGGRSK